MRLRCLLLLACAIFVPCVRADGSVAEIAALRREIAVHWSDPEPHLKLAKIHRDAGNRLLAFYMSEHVRHVIAPESVFNPAFARVFLSDLPADDPARARDLAAWQAKINPALDQPAVAAALVDEALKALPDEGVLHAMKALFLADAGDLKAAEASFARAVELSPNAVMVQGAAGSFFLHVRHDPGRALEHYLSAYFLDPHFYDGEYAESRIRELAWERAGKTVTKAGADLDPLLSSEDPCIVTRAMTAMGMTWKPRHVPALVALLAHDDVNVRAAALAVLEAQPSLMSPEQVDQLLASEDLRQRGMAGYLYLQRTGKKGVERIAPWLDAREELVRFDGISALAMHGGAPGRARLREYAPRETNPMLKYLLTTLP